MIQRQVRFSEEFIKEVAEYKKKNGISSWSEALRIAAKLGMDADKKGGT